MPDGRPIDSQLSHLAQSISSSSIPPPVETSPDNDKSDAASTHLISHRMRLTGTRRDQPHPLLRRAQSRRRVPWHEPRAVGVVTPGEASRLEPMEALICRAKRMRPERETCARQQNDKSAPPH